MKKPVSIFIVDDDPGMFQTLSYILTEMGYEVDTAQDGFEAVKRIQEKGFDVVLMDIKMPGMNGVEVLKEINKFSPDTTTVMMTAYSMEELIREAKKEGALTVLPKPLDLDKVIAFIQEFCAQQPILIVDDNLDFCRSLQDILNEKGYDTAIATEVDEAIHLVLESRYDIIFLDMKLNGVTGTDAALAIKKIDPKAIIILITGHQAEMEGLIAEALKSSAYRCLYKPLDIEALLGLLKSIERNKLQQLLGESVDGQTEDFNH